MIQKKCIECNKWLSLDEISYGHDCEDTGEETTDELDGYTYAYMTDQKFLEAVESIINDMNDPSDEDLGEDYYIVDVSDKFILARGTLEECNETVDTLYGGVMVFNHSDLPEGIKNLEDYDL